MSLIQRRAVSTLIPPKIASPSGIGGAKNAARMQRVVNFYEGLPRGPAPVEKPKGLLGRYQARYFGEKTSAAPLAHIIGAFMVLGYGMEYYKHLRHHKNNAVHLTSNHILSQLSNPTGTVAYSHTDQNLVMDELAVQDVVKHQSEGEPSLSGTIEDNLNSTATNGELLTAKHSKDAQDPRTSKSSDFAETTNNYEGGVVDGIPQNEKQHSVSVGFEDEVVEQNAFDGSAGSDSDTAKHRGADQKTDDKGHARTNSLKKPSAFRPVSVTKSFLAKSMMVNPASNKTTGEKGTVSASNAPGSASLAQSRPRLVMKSTSGLRDSIPLSANGIKGSERDSIPDGSNVWNKNKPTQPSAPKHLTDEELKQQYDIHLAPRLQADEGKEAKWADIDDEDTSWVPDAIEWTDGTKTSLPNPEEQQAAAAARIPAQQRDAHPNTQKLSDLKFTSLSNGPSKIQNAFVSPNPSNPTSRAPGLVLKGASEKPTLVAKPPGPSVPVKSPWAQLPPVDKTAPLPSNPQHPSAPLQQPIQRFSQRNPHGFDDMPPQPAKEIAADDFNRSWRDNQSFSNRELFNSQSGRYEPVSDGRRSSIRQDQQFRPPSLLQRPAPGDLKNVADASPTFQSHRSAANADGNWSRRRASSNLSATGNAPVIRRMSVTKGSGLLPNGGEQTVHRSVGQTSVDTLSSPVTLIQPQASRNEPNSLPSNPTRSATHMNGSSSSAFPSREPDARQSVLDPLVMQKGIMQQAREKAQQRRLAEEKEEAEKRERLRLKIEALDMPRKEPKSEKQDVPVANRRSVNEGSDAPIAKSPPKPPVPEVSGEIIHYGLIKVHPSEAAKPTLRSTTGHPPRESSNNTARKGLVSTQFQVNTRDIEETSRDPSIAATSTPLRSSTTSEPEPPFSNVQQKQGWSPMASGSWVGPGITNHAGPSRNLWGPPSNDKALGNGTFDDNLSRITHPTHGHPPQLSPGPGPIGPPSTSPRISGPSSASQSSTQFPHSMPQPDLRTEPSGLQPLTTPHNSLFRQTPTASQPVSDARRQPARPYHADGSMAAPASRMSHSQQQQAKAAWGAFSEDIGRREREEDFQHRQRLSTRQDTETNAGVKSELDISNYNAKWKEVTTEKSDDTAAKTHFTSAGSAAHAIPPHPKTDSKSLGQTQNVAHSGVRPSRFFPQSMETNKSHIAPSSPLQGHPRATSPPPPDSPNHPVWDGDRTKPHVLLPVPKPVVKLPPSDLVAPTSIVAPPASQPSPERVIATTSTGHAWQDRFNDLFGRKVPSPPRSYALAVNSGAASRNKQPTSANFATVSLPKAKPDRFTTRIFVVDNSSDVISRLTDDVLLGEPDVGSKPVVRIPLIAPPNLYNPAKPSNLLRGKSRLPRYGQIEVLSVGVLDNKEHNTSIRIRLPKQEEAILMRAKPSASQNRQLRPSQGNNRKKSQKFRDASGKPNGPKSSGSGPRPNHSGNWHKREATATPASK
ncbi:MAG: hypothetical protein M1814_000731 [Vezdaea aestivalis]|nr:MAG: hypothetical protein M1814_000731 [Vezdaea aestivalis]